MNEFPSIGKLPPKRSELVEAARANTTSIPTGQVITLEPKDRYYDLIEREQTPSQVRSTLSGALTGDLHRQGLFFDNVIDTWPRLQTNLEEVVTKVSKAPFKVVPFSKKGEKPTKSALERASHVEDALLGMKPKPKKGEVGLEGLIQNLAMAYYTGHTVCEIHWKATENGFLPSAAKDIPWRFFGYPTTDEGEDRLMLSKEGYGSAQLEDFPQHKFLIAVRKAHKGHATVSAPLRALSQTWLSSFYGRKWLQTYGQLFGMPFRTATYTDSTDLKKLEEMMRNLGSAGWGAFQDGVKIDIKEAKNAAGNLPQKVLMDSADTECDIFILGQTLTTSAGDKGSQALGNVHADIRIDKLQAVADFVAQILTYQFAESLLAINFGDTEEAPTIKIEFPRPKDEKALVERDKTLHVEMNLPVAIDDLYERHGVKKPEEGAELFIPPSPQPNGVQGDPVTGDITSHETKAARVEAKATSEGVWTDFDKSLGALGIPRSEMPQIHSGNRAAFIGFLKARGIAAERLTVFAKSLKPTQSNYSPEKVAKSKAHTGGSRAILVSEDNHILDGHHQWYASYESDEPIEVIKIGVPMRRLLPLAHIMPSSTVEASNQTVSHDEAQELFTKMADALEKDGLLDWEALGGLLTSSVNQTE